MLSAFDVEAEFDRQLQNLLAAGYPAVVGTTEEAFTELVAPLREEAVARAAGMTRPNAAAVPFLIVVPRALAPLDRTVPLLTLKGKQKPGVIDRNYKGPEDVATFVTLPELLADGASVAAPYLVFDVERGEEFCDVVPQDAMATISGRGRTLLSIEEGIALATQVPEALEKNKCFELGGSRNGDRRVPALWISQGAPKLGWCWAGNPHTWLGMASAGSRRQAVTLG